MQRRDGRDPATAELVDEHRPVQPGDALPHLHPLRRVRNARAGGVGTDDVGEDPGEAVERQRRRSGVGRAVRIEEHFVVPFRQPVAALVRVILLVCDLEHARHRLLLQPLPRVTRVDPRALRELPRRGGSRCGQRRVQAEPRPEVHAQQLDTAQ